MILKGARSALPNSMVVDADSGPQSTKTRVDRFAPTEAGIHPLPPGAAAFQAGGDPRRAGCQSVPALSCEQPLIITPHYHLCQRRAEALQRYGQRITDSWRVVI